MSYNVAYKMLKITDFSQIVFVLSTNETHTHTYTHTPTHTPTHTHTHTHAHTYIHTHTHRHTDGRTTDRPTIAIVDNATRFSHRLQMHM